MNHSLDERDFVWRRLSGCEGELCRPPCENGGRCLANEKGDWRCYCWPDFSGERCEVNHCTDYCLNGGTCTGSALGESTADTAGSSRFLQGPLLFLCYRKKVNKAHSIARLQSEFTGSCIRGACSWGILHQTVIYQNKVVKRMFFLKTTPEKCHQKQTMFSYMLEKKNSHFLPLGVWMCHSWHSKGVLGNKK